LSDSGTASSAIFTCTSPFLFFALDVYEFARVYSVNALARGNLVNINLYAEKRYLDRTRNKLYPLYPDAFGSLYVWSTCSPIIPKLKAATEPPSVISLDKKINNTETTQLTNEQETRPEPSSKCKFPKCYMKFLKTTEIILALLRSTILPFQGIKYNYFSLFSNSTILYFLFSQILTFLISGNKHGKKDAHSYSCKNSQF
jgi:hypothetical protein